MKKKKRIVQKAKKTSDPKKLPKLTKPAKPAQPAGKPLPSGPQTEADKMAAKQRDISVSEFFLKNRHLLGFDNAKKALLTTIKEAVDNSLFKKE